MLARENFDERPFGSSGEILPASPSPPPAQPKRVGLPPPEWAGEPIPSGPPVASPPPLNALAAIKEYDPPPPRPLAKPIRR